MEIYFKDFIFLSLLETCSLNSLLSCGVSATSPSQTMVQRPCWRERLEEKNAERFCLRMDGGQLSAFCKLLGVRSASKLVNPKIPAPPGSVLWSQAAGGTCCLPCATSNPATAKPELSFSCAFGAALLFQKCSFRSTRNDNV